MAFGKRTNPPAGNGGFGVPPNGPRTTQVVYPWTHDPKAFTACNMALGNLAANLPGRLVVAGRLHAETLMVGVGVVAGFSAQCLMRKTLIETGRAQQGRDFHLMTTVDGGTYLFGDTLNDLIVSTTEVVPTRYTLAMMLGGAAIQSGLAISDIPPFEPLFQSVAASLRDGRYGELSAPAVHAPNATPLQLLDRLWPFARKCLMGTLPGDRNWGAAPFEYWTSITSLVAQKFFLEVGAVLNPKIAYGLALESAIIASKLHPATVADGVI